MLPAGFLHLPCCSNNYTVSILLDNNNYTVSILLDNNNYTVSILLDNICVMIITIVTIVQRWSIVNLVALVYMSTSTCYIVYNPILHYGQ